jgi:hypothetical protein
MTFLCCLCVDLLLSLPKWQGLLPKQRETHGVFFPILSLRSDFCWQRAARFATIASCVVHGVLRVRIRMGSGEVLEWPNRAAC